MTTPQPRPDLLARARAGDGEAFRRLLEPIRGTLTAQARRQLPRVLRRRVSESDVIQEVSIAAFRSLSTFEDRGPDSFRHWIARMVSNQVREAIRRHLSAEKRSVGREVSATHGSPAPERPRNGATPSQEVMASELAVRLQRETERLPADYREVIRAVHGEGLTLAAIAVRMGRSAEAVRKLYARGIAQLTDNIPELGGEEA